MHERRIAACADTAAPPKTACAAVSAHVNPGSILPAAGLSAADYRRQELRPGQPEPHVGSADQLQPGELQPRLERQPTPRCNRAERQFPQQHLYGDPGHRDLVHLGVAEWLCALEMALSRL